MSKGEIGAWHRFRAVRLSDFDFELPERLIAQHPLPARDESRMMVIHRDTGAREHRIFRDLPTILDARHFLVVNNSRVLPARLRAHRPGKEEQIEVLLVRAETENDWLALLKPGRKASAGQQLHIGDLRARIINVLEGGVRLLRFERHPDLRARFEEIGEAPLPPYIRRSPGSSADDRIRYQTVYARHPGSVAAPTAGLHFTPEILDRLQRRGVEVCEILLHVGYGTFQPVRTEAIENHRMLPEYFAVGADSAARVRRLRSEGRSLVAVGTTTTRVLEYLMHTGNIRESSGFVDLFIYPGFEFRALDGGLLTNFHLPKSTLLMLVSAFAGRQLTLDCYREAISEGYRFYSYGDCMLIV
jgi:S-adenosylmethionine:tRNA ribosyltransferase-isomerase